MAFGKSEFLNLKSEHMKTRVSILAFLLTALSLHAQQDPQYTQYMYNMNVVNPAYAGSGEDLSIGLLYRSQWVGMPGAPKTGTFDIHGPVGNNVGLGLSAISDKYGPVEENNVYADFSYTLKLGGQHRLAFGIKAGVTFHKVGLFSDIGNGHVINPGDLAFSENSNSSFLNIGAGVYYYTDKYYIGFSVPNMLKNNYLDLTKNGNEYEFGTDKQHYFLTGGYVFDLSENTKFKPAFMLKTAFGAPVSFDITANFRFFDRFEVGAFYRLEDSFGGLVNFSIIPQLRIGYAYDHITSALNKEVSASHEILLLIDLNFAKKVTRSPRFF